MNNLSVQFLRYNLLMILIILLCEAQINAFLINPQNSKDLKRIVQQVFAKKCFEHEITLRSTFKKSKRSFQLALSRNPTDRWNRVRDLKANRDSKGAVALLNQLIENNTSPPDIPTIQVVTSLLSTANSGGLGHHCNKAIDWWLENETSQRFKPPNAFFYTAALKACANPKHNDPHRALGLLQAAAKKVDKVKNQENRTTLPATCYNMALQACAETKQLQLAEEVLELMKNQSVELNTRSCNAYIRCCSRVGDWRKAVGVIHALGVEDERGGCDFPCLPDERTYSMAMHACVSSGQVAVAQELLDHMVAAGLKPNTVAYTTLLKGYAKKGDAVRASGIMSKMADDGVAMDSVSYTAAIQAYCKAGSSWLERAWKLLQNAEKEGAIDMVTYYTMISGCGDNGDWKKAVGILTYMENKGLVLQPKVYNAALYACIKASKVAEASKLLKEMEKRGLGVSEDTFHVLMKASVRSANWEEAIDMLGSMEARGLKASTKSYNIAIDACLMANQLDAADELFRVMEEKGCLPDAVTFGTLIKGASMKGDAAQALELLDHMRSKGIQGSDQVYHTVLAAICRSGQMLKAEGFAQEMKKIGLAMDTVGYNTLMKGWADVGMWDIVFKCLDQLLTEGNVPTLTTYKIVLEAVAGKQDSILAEQILSNLLEQGLKPDRGIYNLLLNVHAKSQNIESMKAVLVQMVKEGFHPDVQACTIVMNGYASAGDIVGAELWLKEMQYKWGVHPNEATLNTVIKACGSNWGKAIEYLQKMSEFNMVPNIITYSNVMNVCIKNGQVEVTRSLLDALISEYTAEDLDATVFNVVMSGYSALNDLSSALDILKIMTEHGVAPNLISYNTAISIAAKHGDLQTARTLFEDLEAQGLSPNYMTYSAMKKCFRTSEAAHQDSLLQLEQSVDNKISDNSGLKMETEHEKDEARQLLQQMQSNGIACDQITFLVLLKDCVKGGDWHKAATFLNLMPSAGVEISTRAYNILMDACAEAGDLNQAKRFYQQMVDQGLKPDQVSFNTLIKAAVRKRKPQEALSLLRSMVQKGLEPDNISYRFAIKCLCAEGENVKALKVLDLMQTQQVVPDSRTIKFLLMSLASDSAWPAIIHVFEKSLAMGVEGDVSIFNTAINAGVKLERMDLSYNYFMKMKEQGLNANMRTYRYLLKGYSRSPPPEESDSSS